MPVLSDFQPENQSYGRTLQFGQSMMDRAQASRLREEQAQQQRAEFQAKLPVIQAAAQADIASAHASVQNAALMEQFRGQAASESKALNDEYLAAIRMPSFEEQSKALSALQPRVAYMDILPEYKGFVTAVNNATLRAHGSAQLDRQLNSKVDIATMQAEMRAQNAEALRVQKEAHDKESLDARFALQDAKAAGKRNEKYDQTIGEGDAKRFTASQENVGKFEDSLNQTARARELLKQDTQQGRGRGTVLSFQQAVNSFVPGTFDTAKAEALTQTYAEMGLAAAAKMKGQGSITENERAFLAKSVANFGNSPEAALYIMDFMDAVSRREIAKADYFAELDAKGERVTAKLENDFRKQHPIAEYLNSSIKQAPDQETSTGGGKTLEPIKVLSVTRGD